MTVLEGISQGRKLEQDDPVVQAAIAANTRPAEIRAVSCLAEDTIFAQTVGAEPLEVVPFRNPFSSLEEVLFIASDHTLWHAARGVGTAEPGTAGAGWRTTKVSGNVTSVVPVVHPNGCVYAFCTTQQSTGGVPGHLAVWELAAFNSDSGVSTWGQVDDGLPNDFDEVTSVHVQYVDDRNATRVVFAVNVDAVDGMGKVAAIFGSWDNHVQPWEPRYYYDVDSDLVGGLFAMGYDDTSFSWLRTYSALENGELWQRSYHVQGDSPKELVDTAWKTGVAGFSGPSGFGAVGIGTGGELRVFSLFGDGTASGSGETSTLRLASAYASFHMWQDGAGLMHLYAIDQGSQLNVLHQTRWEQYTAGAHPSFPPVWDTVLSRGGVEIAAMRPLVSKVLTYGLDPHPDNMPNQCVFRDAGPEAMEVLTQQLGTNYWESEVVRVAYTLADELPPYLAPRYKTQVTVVDAGGSRVPMCAVTVTADAPVDIEVAGTFYRIRPTLPVTLTTDMAGSLVLKVKAEGLATPILHLSAQGVVQALTLQPAAEVHKFLAGAGQLPTQRGGLMSETLLDAKTPSGDPLFPVFDEDQHDDWPPKPEDVLCWLQAAFAISAKTSLPEGMRSRLCDGEEVLGFSLQTHDRSRPALEVFTTLDQLAAHRVRIGASDPDPSMQEWFGDVVEGVRSAAVKVSQVSVDLVDGTLTGVVNMAGNAIKSISGFWDDSNSAAHCVELMLNALGASISDAVAWLTWPLNLADVWWAKGCMEGMLEDVMTEFKSCITDLQALGTKWTESADDVIDEAVSAAAEVFGNQYTGRFERPSMDPSTMPAGFGALFPSLPDWSPHLTWWQELVERFCYEIPFDDTGNPVEDLIDKLTKLPGWTAFESVLTSLGKDIEHVFDPANPNSWSQILLTAFVNASADIAKGGVALAGLAFDAMCDFAAASADLVTEWYGSKTLAIPALASVWDWIQVQAEVDPADRQSLTYGRAAMFLWCYPGTAGYKVLFGAKPFADGAPTVADLKKGATAMAELRARPGETPDPGVQYPYVWPAHATLQYFCAQQMTADAAFDWKINSQALKKAAGDPYIKMTKPELCIWAFLHQLAYGFGDMPYVWGNGMYDPAKSTPDKWGPGVMWAMSLIANSADVGVAAKWGYFVNAFDESKVAGHFLLGPCHRKDHHLLPALLQRRRPGKLLRHLELRHQRDVLRLRDRMATLHARGVSELAVLGVVRDRMGEDARGLGLRRVRRHCLGGADRLRIHLLPSGR